MKHSNIFRLLNKLHTFLLLILISLFFNKTTKAQMDFGDAPDPTYPTLLATNGARHMLGGNFLGTQIDTEVDGSAVPFANGDDLNGIDDEDGVLFPSWLVPGQNATILITASLPGFLDAWIDIQGNGDWLDPGDQIFTSQILNGGSNTLTFLLSPLASSGIFAYCRFRFSSMGGLSFTGSAIDGEVEDYQIYLGLPTIGNTVVDPDPGLDFVQNEISMDIEPLSGNLVLAYNDNPYPNGPGIGVSYSADQGQSWISQQLSIPVSSISGIQLVDAFDPTITSDASGNTFVAQISTDFNWGTGPVNGLYVHKSTDGGVNWNTPIAIDEEAAPTSSNDPNYRFNDRCQIIADKDPLSPYFNNIYIAWIKDRGWNQPNPDSDIYMSVSTDGGSTFSTANQINHTLNSMGNMPTHTVTSNGDLYVLWMQYNVISGGIGVMLLDKSTDGGVTFGNDITVDSILLPPLQLNGGVEARAKGAAIIRSHPSNPNELYVVYAADPDTLGNDEADIFFIKSTDGGNNWSSPPLQLNDDTTKNDQVLPWMEVNNNGVINVVWYDRRNDPFDLAWDVYTTTSIDGGTTFGVNTQINVSSFSTPTTASGPWFGEYLALASADTMAYVAFTSTALDPLGDVLFTSFSNPIINLAIDEVNDFWDEPNVYPNPTSESLSIDIGNNHDVEIEIFDFLGKRIIVQHLFDQITTINLNKYAPGVYLIQMSYNDKIITKKIVKN